MTLADVVALVLWLGLTAYAILAGADFGAGVLDLLAGGAERGRDPRRLIDSAISPVWEANHTWLIFDLVILWTAFPVAFAAIMRTLFVPLALAAAGIVIRGSGFAFRKVVGRLSGQRLFGAGFAFGSLLTPFFLGAALGAIASGRVPAEGTGDLLSWMNPTSMATGTLAVVGCTYLAAVFLVADARRRGIRELEAYFRRRALVTGVLAGILAIASLAILDLDAPALFGGLRDQGLPLIGLSVACGALALILLARGAAVASRALAAGAVGAVVIGWGVAQFPVVLPPGLTVALAAAPDGTLIALVVVTVVAAALVGPSLALLFVLDQRSHLEPHGGPWL
jgi:cytochrome bd ubiquinol oxidase subunit II